MAVGSLGQHGLIFLALSPGAHGVYVTGGLVANPVGLVAKLVGSGRHDLPRLFTGFGRE
jgi:hypothetical protein